MKKSRFSVAIDGPAGAGKSTMARRVAQELGILYVDTGAIYRTVGYHMWLYGIGPKDVDGVTRLLDDVNIQIEHQPDGVQHMILNGKDVSCARPKCRATPPAFRRCRSCGRFCWICSGSSRVRTARSWTGATSERSFCRTRT